MLAAVELQPITLAARSVHRIEKAGGLQVSCARGVAWITQERDPRDIILAAGHSVVLDRPGLAVVFAFKESVITVGPAPAEVPQQAPASAARARADRAWA